MQSINRIEQVGGEHSHIARKLLEMTPFLPDVIREARETGQDALASRLEQFYQLLTA